MTTRNTDLAARIRALRSRHEERDRTGTGAATAVEPPPPVAPAPAVEDDEPVESIMIPAGGGPLSTTESTHWCVPPRSVRERGRFR